jgi:hypothetical protein
VAAAAVGLVAVLLSAPASPSSSREATRAGSANVPWSAGTITFIANLSKTLHGKDSYGAPLSLTERYQETAVYTLTGKSAGGDLMQAKMTGSGTGTSTYAGGQQGTCNLNTSPTNKWAYKGPATVKMTYSANSLYVYAQPVMTKLHTVFTGCSGTQVPPLDRTAAAPVHGFAFFTVKVSPRVGKVTGDRSSPIQEHLTNNQLSGTVGTSTVRWALSSGLKACVNPTGKNKCP